MVGRQKQTLSEKTPTKVSKIASTKHGIIIILICVSNWQSEELSCSLNIYKMEIFKLVNQQDLLVFHMEFRDALKQQRKDGIIKFL